ncbi:hypothetical protein WME79_36135 [Sorangium sp. So ce726]|uniref:hypothetical protein n=1 Tax=Sorangium sp. So ce726 TaxID=3133319 RepID=UPI003F5FBE8B
MSGRELQAEPEQHRGRGVERCVGEFGSVAGVEACAGSVASGRYMAARLGRPGAAAGVEVDARM